MFYMPRLDPNLCECLAYALWRSPWRKRLEGLDACRMAAQDIERHLRRSGYELERRPAMEPHGRLAQANNENDPPRSD
ncbi:hypothetical protein NHF45_12305 [Maricaulaceae bacterium NA33B04]|nr:hypothetical protein [Maricaulaceae bacterium NA33B04]